MGKYIPNIKRSPFPERFLPTSGDIWRPCCFDRSKTSVVPKAPAPRKQNSFCDWSRQRELTCPLLKNAVETYCFDPEELFLEMIPKHRPPTSMPCEMYSVASSIRFFYKLNFTSTKYLSSPIPGIGKVCCRHRVFRTVIETSAFMARSFICLHRDTCTVAAIVEKYGQRYSIKLIFLAKPSRLFLEMLEFVWIWTIRIYKRLQHCFSACVVCIGYTLWNALHHTYM